MTLKISKIDRVYHECINSCQIITKNKVKIKVIVTFQDTRNETKFFSGLFFVAALFFPDAFSRSVYPDQKSTCIGRHRMLPKYESGHPIFKR